MARPQIDKNKRKSCNFCADKVEVIDYKDVQKMSDEDVIKNMSAELFKLNDINRQKMRTMKWTLTSFSLLLSAILIIAVLFLINSI